MRKTLLAASICSLSLAPLVASADIHDTRAFARGGAGITMGGYHQALANPALLARATESDWFSLGLNVGVLASDKDGLIDSIDDADEGIEALENKTGDVTAEEVNEILQSANDKLAQIDVGGALLIAVPNQLAPMAFVAKTRVSLGLEFFYDSNDLAILQDIENDVPGASGDDLDSQVAASGVFVSEYGLMAGHRLNDELSLGATLKAQKIDLYAYQASVSNFEADEIEDSDFNRSHSSVNIDLGATYRMGDFIFAGTVENLIPQSFTGPAFTDPAAGTVGTTDYKMNPVITAGAGFGNGWLKTEANLDLTARKGFDLLGDNQFFRLGAEVSAGRHAQLRAGFRTDMKNNVADIITVGFGISPWGKASLDLTAAVGDGDTFGVGLQLGMRI